MAYATPEAAALVARRGLAGLPYTRGRSFDRGELVIRADFPADAAYLIRRGQVRCFLLDPEGRETTTAVVGPGQLVGFAPFIGDSVHHQFAQALTRLDAWMLPAEHIHQPTLAQAASATVALQGLALGCLFRRLDLVIALLRGVALLSVADRIRDMEPRLSASLGTDHLKVKRTALAGLLQIRPETLARSHLPEPLDASPTTLPINRRSPGPGMHDFAPDEVVLDGGLPSGSTGLVTAGRLQLSVIGPGSRAVPVDVLEAGDIFSTGALVGLPASSLRLVATAPGAIEILPAGDMLDRLASSPATLGELVARCVRRLERLERGLAFVALRDVRERLLHVLREISSGEELANSQPGRLIPARWSHVALATHLGVCRETVTRGLAALDRAGDIRREGRRIVLLRADDRHDGQVVAFEPTQAETDHAAPAAPTSLQRPARRRSRCRLCGLASAGVLCEGCAERLERDLEQDRNRACPTCGRHRELCRLMACGAPPAAPDPEVGKPREVPKAPVTWLPLESIDEPASIRNSRRSYRDSSIRELAASLGEEGFLQPLCVRPNGSRYELVFGVRRLRAAREAGLAEAPCTIRSADDRRAFLLNAVENLHREQLSKAERIATIERLAATGLGVREISRRTGFNASTISRWLRINGRIELKQALEDGRLDIAHAVILVEAPVAALPTLIERAPHVSAAELRRQVAAVKREGRAASLESDDRRRLLRALRNLQAVETSGEDDLLRSIRHELERLAARSQRKNGAGPKIAIRRLQDRRHAGTLHILPYSLRTP